MAKQSTETQQTSPTLTASGAPVRQIKSPNFDLKFNEVQKKECKTLFDFFDKDHLIPSTEEYVLADKDPTIFIVTDLSKEPHASVAYRFPSKDHRTKLLEKCAEVKEYLDNPPRTLRIYLLQPHLSNRELLNLLVYSEHKDSRIEIHTLEGDKTINDQFLALFKGLKDLKIKFVPLKHNPHAIRKENQAHLQQLKQMLGGKQNTIVKLQIGDATPGNPPQHANTVSIPFPKTKFGSYVGQIFSFLKASTAGDISAVLQNESVFENITTREADLILDVLLHNDSDGKNLLSELNLKLPTTVTRTHLSRVLNGKPLPPEIDWQGPEAYKKFKEAAKVKSASSAEAPVPAPYSADKLASAPQLKQKSVSRFSPLVESPSTPGNFYALIQKSSAGTQFAVMYDVWSRGYAATADTKIHSDILLAMHTEINHDFPQLEILDPLKKTYFDLRDNKEKPYVSEFFVTGTRPTLSLKAVPDLFRCQDHACKVQLGIESQADRISGTTIAILQPEGAASLKDPKHRVMAKDLDPPQTYYQQLTILYFLVVAIKRAPWLIKNGDEWVAPEKGHHTRHSDEIIEKAQAIRDKEKNCLVVYADIKKLCKEEAAKEPKRRHETGIRAFKMFDATFEKADLFMMDPRPDPDAERENKVLAIEQDDKKGKKSTLLRPVAKALDPKEAIPLGLEEDDLSVNSGSVEEGEPALILQRQSGADDGGLIVLPDDPLNEGADDANEDDEDDEDEKRPGIGGLGGRSVVV